MKEIKKIYRADFLVELHPGGNYLFILPCVIDGKQVRLKAYTDCLNFVNYFKFTDEEGNAYQVRLQSPLMNYTRVPSDFYEDLKGLLGSANVSICK